MNHNPSTSAERTDGHLGSPHISYSFLLLHFQNPRCRCSYCSSSTWPLLYKRDYQPDRHFSTHCPIFRLKQGTEELSPFSSGTKTPARKRQKPQTLRWCNDWQGWQTRLSDPAARPCCNRLSCDVVYFHFNVPGSDDETADSLTGRERESNENRGSMWPKGNPTLRDSSLSKNSQWNVFSLNPTRADLSNMLFIRKKNWKPTKVKQKLN